MSQEFFELFEKLVPRSGQALTVQGELIRAINGMADDYATNGSANWDAGYERLAAFALRHLTDGTFGPQTSTGIVADIDCVQRHGRRQHMGDHDLEEAFFRLMEAGVGWCQRHQHPIPHSPDPELKR